MSHHCDSLTHRISCLRYYQSTSDDPDGWQYAFRIKSSRWYSKKHYFHYVRRRIWKREIYRESDATAYRQSFMIDSSQAHKKTTTSKQ